MISKKVPSSCQFCGGMMECVSEVLGVDKKAMKTFVFGNGETMEFRTYELYECVRCPYTVMWRYDA